MDAPTYIILGVVFFNLIFKPKNKAVQFALVAMIAIALAVSTWNTFTNKGAARGVLQVSLIAIGSIVVVYRHLQRKKLGSTP